MMTCPDQLEITACLDQLMNVLDTDADTLNTAVSCLHELRALMVRQDQEALKHLLDTLRRHTETCRGNEFHRQALRKKLAGHFGCPVEHITLSGLESRVPQERRAAVIERRAQLQRLTALLKKEYAGTQTLLADCARFNRRLLKTLLESGRPQTVTYSSSGAAKRTVETVFMDMRF